MEILTVIVILLATASTGSSARLVGTAACGPTACGGGLVGGGVTGKGVAQEQDYSIAGAAGAKDQHLVALAHQTALISGNVPVTIFTPATPTATITQERPPPMVMSVEEHFASFDRFILVLLETLTGLGVIIFFVIGFMKYHWSVQRARRNVANRVVLPALPPEPPPPAPPALPPPPPVQLLNGGEGA